MIKKITVVATTVAVLVFSGCGDDRSHPKGVDAAGNPIVYANPTAVIDLNSTTHDLVRGVYNIDTVDTGNPFIFDGSKSQDNDENNQSIVGYQWSVNHTFTAACVDINTTGTRAVFKFINVDVNDTNQTCYNEATDNGEINTTLTVTDDEGKTAIARKNIKTN